MENNRVKVLIICNPLKYGGMDHVAISLQQNLDKEKFECVYCLTHDDEEGPLEETVRQSGVRIIHMPTGRNIRFKCYKFLNNFFKQEHFDVVHSHLPFMSLYVFLAAKKNGVNKRIVHSHYSSQTIELSKGKKIVAEIYRSIMRACISILATDVIGCTQEAGIYVAGKRGFKKKGIVLNNGIDTSVYEYNEETRNRKREELGVDSQIVLGHVGQIYPIKNQAFLIDIFYEYQKKHKNSLLLIVGDGPDKEKIVTKVKCLGISDKVKFLGFRDDVPELLMAMDCMVFPSISEGYPLTLIEAQATKLPCVVSDSVICSAKINENFSFCSLNENVNNWCNEIDGQMSKERFLVENSDVAKLYDIKSVSKKLESIYLN